MAETSTMSLVRTSSRNLRPPFTTRHDDTSMLSIVLPALPRHAAVSIVGNQSIIRTSGIGFPERLCANKTVAPPFRFSRDGIGARIAKVETRVAVIVPFENPSEASIEAL